MEVKNKIQITRAKEIKRNWHLIDAKGEILGRMSTKIAILLMGKEKSYYVPNLDCGDTVVVINAREIGFSGDKAKQKISCVIQDSLG